MTDRQTYQKRLQSLKEERKLHEPDWREMGEWFMTRLPRHLLTSANPGGPRRNTKIIDNTPVLARRTAVAGLMGGYTSPSKPWFRFATPDPELMEFPAVRIWLQSVENIIRNIFNKSNLYNVLPFLYDESMVYGAGSATILEDQETTIRLYPHVVGTYCLSQNEKYVTDTIYRELKFRVHQLVSMFGIENLTERTLAFVKNQQFQQMIDVVHLIEPNTDRQYGLLDNRNMAWRSVWYEAGGSQENEKFLRRSGFQEFPTVSFHWNKDDPNDCYGVGIAMDTLGDAKELQFQHRRKAQAIDKLVDPPLQAPTALKDSPVFGMPGGITHVDIATGAQGLKPVYEIKPDIRALNENIETCQYRIDRAFYVDLFLMMNNDTRSEPATATEVAERHEEKLVMLGPTLEQLNRVLKMIIDRTFAISYRGGMIPKPPRELEGVDLKIDYISVLAQAQKMVDIGGIERLWGFGQMIAQIEPSVMDKLDADQSIDEYADRVGVPAGIIRSDADVVDIRKVKAQQQAAAQQMAELADRAKATKDLSQATLSEDNALAAVTGAGARDQSAIAAA